MKMLKIWSLAAMLLMTMVACNKSNDPSNEPSGNLDAIEKEWQLVSVNGVANEFTVYVNFDAGTFSIYQQVYDLSYMFYDGQYSISGSTVSGTYFNGDSWKCDYTASITSDGNTLTLKSKEENAITCIYQACVIPESVKAEAITRSAEYIQFL